MARELVFHARDLVDYAQGYNAEHCEPKEPRSRRLSWRPRTYGRRVAATGAGIGSLY